MTEPLETRIRQILKLPGDAPDGMGFVDLVDALRALGVVVAECLAHMPEETAVSYLDQVLTCRREWQAQPRVLEQLKPEGRA
jgi:hypothetical protein